MNDDEAGTAYVMVRVADLDPQAGSPELRIRRITTLCDCCQAPCWLDPLSLRGVDPQVRRICLQCADALITGQAAQVPQ